MEINFKNLSTTIIITGFSILIAIILIRNSFEPRVIAIFISGIFGILLVLSSGHFFIRGKVKLIESFTFSFISIVVFIMLLFIIVQDSVFGMRIDEMPSEIARFYYEQIITVLVGLFTGFMLGVSILWVGFKPVHDKKGKYIGGTKIRDLTKHTIFLFLLFGYVVFCIYLGILIDLSKQIIGI